MSGETAWFQRFDAPSIRDLSIGLWVGLPLFVFFFPLIADLVYFHFHPDDICLYDFSTGLYESVYCNRFWNEIGFIELLTALFLVLAIRLGIKNIKDASILPATWLKHAYTVLVVVLVIYLGEELSWGQHFFGWKMSDAWRDGNFQGETNFHNMTGAALHIPLSIAKYAVALGGLLTPALLMFLGRGKDPAGWMYWFLPTYICIPTAVFFCIAARPLRTVLIPIIGDWYPVSFPWEIVECMTGLIAFLYFRSLRLRLDQYAATRPAQDSGHQPNA